MNNQPIDIDRIVREIVDRLRAELDRPVATLTLDSRVVTMADLEGKLDGVRQFVLGPNTIITPLARDELKEKKIEITRAPTE